MTNSKKGDVVNFSIDGIPDFADSAKSHKEDYALELKDLLGLPFDSNTETSFPSTNAIKKAGRSIRKNQGDIKEATKVIHEFRAAHEKPLEIIAILISQCCTELSISVKPVKRLKKLETIIDKLQRQSLDGKTTNQTCVTNMNDIGGCRAILPDMNSLNLVRDKLAQKIESEQNINILRTHDYIKDLKSNDCGYRSLHLIFECKEDSGKKFKIEAQLRTHMQQL